MLYIIKNNIKQENRLEKILQANKEDPSQKNTTTSQLASESRRKAASRNYQSPAVTHPAASFLHYQRLDPRAVAAAFKNRSITCASLRNTRKAALRSLLRRRSLMRLLRRK